MVFIKTKRLYVIQIDYLRLLMCTVAAWLPDKINIKCDQIKTFLVILL